MTSPSSAQLPTNGLNSDTPIRLDTMTFPLHGARLIEASAGTGKTFTIAGLYLRLLLGHGDEHTRHDKALTVDQILVVTFTEAATAELRDRIRRRIHDARLAFARGHSDDVVIMPLLEQISDHAAAAQVLLQAERQMDEAAIFTIHGFCQRMLTQNAFESGSRFSNEFVSDENELKAQVVADYWRRQFYGLNLELAAQVRHIWASPQALLNDIGGYLTGAPLRLTVAPMAGQLGDLHQINLAKIVQLKTLWLAHQQDFQALIAGSDVNKRSYSSKSLPNWLEQVTQWAQAETLDYSICDKLTKFSQTELDGKSASGSAPSHQVFAAIDEFLAQDISIKTPLIAHAIEHCRHQLAQAKQSKQWLSFDDLLTQLSAAVDADSEQLLVSRIRQLYPVAMIDEFQDTDPLQYSIFSRIYLDQPQCGLLMIGDPKQAIYAFRGADIFTYIKARNQVSAHYTLDTNWRSSSDMVAAVNQVFSQADSPFIYDQDIPFYPVNANPNAGDKSWWLNGEKQPALVCWLQQNEAANSAVNTGDYQQQMAQATAAQIHTILSAAQQQQAQLMNGEKSTTITAGNIAVLVRTGREGRLIKQALSQQGIASVYLSNRDSVFSSPLAQDVQRLLQAALTPEDERALRACLASGLLALDAAQLDQLNTNERRWEQIVSEFKQYHHTWLKLGVLPMLRSVMAKRHIAERLLTEVEGERQLTDLMHLAELLQQAGQEIDSHHGLLRWLAEAIESASLGQGGSEEHIQRLESERNLVQIVTIHKSKGLEYDLVFLPFVISARTAKEAKYYDEHSQSTCLDLSGSSAALAQADKERLAEDLRLIYVALTRAVYGCYLGLAPVKSGRGKQPPTDVHLSAIGYLIQNGQPQAAEQLLPALQQMMSGVEAMALQVIPDMPSEPLFELATPAQQLHANQLSQVIDRHWRMTSYSNLVKQGNHAGESGLDAAMELAGFDIDSADEQVQSSESEQVDSIFTFPRGARPGTFLHTLFERVEFTQPASSEANRKVIAELLQAEQYGEQWQPVLEQLVDTVLSTPLDGQSLRLNSKTPQQRLVEMEFLLPIVTLSSPSLNDLIHYHDPLSAQAGNLQFLPVQGMLKGFIDLVFEHQGKYYVLDWKSNHLGDDPSCYQGEQLRQAMAEHRYDLQYQLYALALHRFLASRLADYDYQRHFGGVYYLFLRGMDGQVGANKQVNGVFSVKPSLALLQEMDQLIDGKPLAPRSNAQGQMELGI